MVTKQGKMEVVSSFETSANFCRTTWLTFHNTVFSHLCDHLRFPMTSLDFLFVLILPAAHRHSLVQKPVPGTFLGINGGLPAIEADKLSVI
jgi:hypothetical protein